MKPQSGNSRSLWAATAEVPEYEALAKNLNIDVCVVGAGITGLTSAYLLAREGRKVVVVDDGTIGSGESGRTTAHITNVIDDRYYKIIDWHGLDNARLAALSQTAAIDKIEEIIHKEKIKCEFERIPAYLFFKEEEEDVFNKEMEALSKVGIPFTKVLHPPVRLSKGFCLEFREQAQFHILQYLSGLAKAIEKLGGEIYTRTHIISVEGGKPVKLKSALGYTIEANQAIMATNSPISDYVSINTREYAYRSYVIAGKVPCGSVEKALYWDDLEPYHYVRIHPLDKINDMLIVGGEDHKTGQENDAEDRYSCLEEWARARFPMIESIDYAWSGQILEPVDGLSFTGAEPEGKENVYIATGDSGMGMTHGTFSAMILCDLLRGKENAWADLYNPGRKTWVRAGEFIRENANMAAQYADWILPGDIESTAEILPGEGGVLREGINMLAVYKDKQGKVHKFSASCTHLGCVLQWNSGEKSWDCPCHGSRYDALGKVLNGPAIINMKKIHSEGDAKE